MSTHVYVPHLWKADACRDCALLKHEHATTTQSQQRGGLKRTTGTPTATTAATTSSTTSTASTNGVKKLPPPVAPSTATSIPKPHLPPPIPVVVASTATTIVPPATVVPPSHSHPPLPPPFPVLPMSLPPANARLERSTSHENLSSTTATVAADVPVSPASPSTNGSAAASSTPMTPPARPARPNYTTLRPQPTSTTKSPTSTAGSGSPRSSGTPEQFRKPALPPASGPQARGTGIIPPPLPTSAGLNGITEKEVKLALNVDVGIAKISPGMESPTNNNTNARTPTHPARKPPPTPNGTLKGPINLNNSSTTTTTGGTVTATPTHPPPIPVSATAAIATTVSATPSVPISISMAVPPPGRAGSKTPLSSSPPASASSSSSLSSAASSSSNSIASSSTVGVTLAPVPFATHHGHTKSIPPPLPANVIVTNNTSSAASSSAAASSTASPSTTSTTAVKPPPIPHSHTNSMTLSIVGGILPPPRLPNASPPATSGASISPPLLAVPPAVPSLQNISPIASPYASPLGSPAGATSTSSAGAGLTPPSLFTGLTTTRPISSSQPNPVVATTTATGGATVPSSTAAAATATSPSSSSLPPSTAVQRLVDFFAVYGRGPLLTSSTDSLTHLRFQPILLPDQRYPLRDYKDSTLSNNTASFCFPQHITLKLIGLKDIDDPYSSSFLSRRPILHRFVLTKLDGSKQFCVTMTVWERMNLEEIDTVFGEIQTYLSNRQLPLGVRNIQEYISLLRTPLEHTYQPQTLYQPKCLTLISTWPFYSLFEEVLKGLYRLSHAGMTETKLRKQAVLKNGETSNPSLSIESDPSRYTVMNLSLPLERILANFLFEIPVPPPGMTVRYIPPGSIHDGVALLISRPQINQLPLCDVNWYLLFRAIDHSTLLGIFCAIAAEQKILFISKYRNLISAICDAILVLLFPFIWAGVYMPILPEPMLEFLYAPVPFIAGMSIETYELRQQDIPDDIVIVELDKNKIRIPEEDTIPSLPESIYTKLMSQLKEHANIRNSSHPLIGLSEHAFPFGMELEKLDAKLLAEQRKAQEEQKRKDKKKEEEEARKKRAAMMAADQVNGTVVMDADGQSSGSISSSLLSSSSSSAIVPPAYQALSTAFEPRQTYIPIPRRPSMESRNIVSTSNNNNNNASSSSSSSSSSTLGPTPTSSTLVHETVSSSPTSAANNSHSHPTSMANGEAISSGDESSLHIEDVRYGFLRLWCKLFSRYDRYMPWGSCAGSGPTGPGGAAAAGGANAAGISPGVSPPSSPPLGPQATPGGGMGQMSMPPSAQSSSNNSSSSTQPQPSADWFNVGGFLSAAPRDARQFLQIFMQTQMFAKFIDDRLLTRPDVEAWEMMKSQPMSTSTTTTPHSTTSSASASTPHSRPAHPPPHPPHQQPSTSPQHQDEDDSGAENDSENENEAGDEVGDELEQYFQTQTRSYAGRPSLSTSNCVSTTNASAIPPNNTAGGTGTKSNQPSQHQQHEGHARHISSTSSSSSSSSFDNTTSHPDIPLCTSVPPPSAISNQIDSSDPIQMPILHQVQFFSECILAKKNRRRQKLFTTITSGRLFSKNKDDMSYLYPTPFLHDQSLLSSKIIETIPPTADGLTELGRTHFGYPTIKTTKVPNSSVNGGKSAIAVYPVFPMLDESLYGQPRKVRKWNAHASSVSEPQQPTPMVVVTAPMNLAGENFSATGSSSSSSAGSNNHSTNSNSSSNNHAHKPIGNPNYSTLPPPRRAGIGPSPPDSPSRGNHTNNSNNNTGPPTLNRPPSSTTTLRATPTDYRIIPGARGSMASFRARNPDGIGSKINEMASLLSFETFEQSTSPAHHTAPPPLPTSASNNSSMNNNPTLSSASTPTTTIRVGSGVPLTQLPVSLHVPVPQVGNKKLARLMEKEREKQERKAKQQRKKQAQVEQQQQQAQYQQHYGTSAINGSIKSIVKKSVEWTPPVYSSSKSVTIQAPAGSATPSNNTTNLSRESLARTSSIFSFVTPPSHAAQHHAKQIGVTISSPVALRVAELPPVMSSGSNSGNSTNNNVSSRSASPSVTPVPTPSNVHTLALAAAAASIHVASTPPPIPHPTVTTGGASSSSSAGTPLHRAPPPVPSGATTSTGAGGSGRFDNIKSMSSPVLNSSNPPPIPSSITMLPPNTPSSSSGTAHSTPPPVPSTPIKRPPSRIDPPPTPPPSLPSGGYPPLPTTAASGSGGYPAATRKPPPLQPGSTGSTPSTPHSMNHPPPVPPPHPISPPAPTQSTRTSDPPVANTTVPPVRARFVPPVPRS